jgi:hypothetical protein
VGTAHNGTSVLGECSLLRKILAALYSYWFIGSRGKRHPESNPRDSGIYYRRLLDKPLDYLSGPLGGRGLFLVLTEEAGYEGVIPWPRCEEQQLWKTGGKTYATK